MKIKVILLFVRFFEFIDFSNILVIKWGCLYEKDVGVVFFNEEGK